MKKKNRSIIPSRILPKNSFRDTVDGKRVWIINRKPFASKREYFESLRSASEAKSGTVEEVEEFEDGAGWQNVSTPAAVSE